MVDEDSHRLGCPVSPRYFSRLLDATVMQQNQHKPNRKLWILCHLSVFLFTIWVTVVSNTKVTKLLLGLDAFVGSEKVLVVTEREKKLNTVLL